MDGKEQGKDEIRREGKGSEGKRRETDGTGRDGIKGGENRRDVMRRQDNDQTRQEKRGEEKKTTELGGREAKGEKSRKGEKLS